MPTKKADLDLESAILKSTKNTAAKTQTYIWYIFYPKYRQLLDIHGNQYKFSKGFPNF